eukprot:CAMPEP_0116878980 /NCGR_PEP_ID=MMETSP0463-20121206/10734_1 /TAXON_ID=181622 /ORGANISM="Strombidinopsis sp, Strain SopsisLIS2011" /LENGTH=68 /DNA_ID=CAMNT_0004527751 /DNA_START=16 /DNA_END=222 /DNA_ORIENTATION=-
MVDLGLDSPVERKNMDFNTNDDNDLDDLDALPSDCIQLKIYLYAEKSLYSKVFPEEFFLASMSSDEYK